MRLKKTRAALLKLNFEERRIVLR